MVATLTRRPDYATPDWKLVGPWYRWPRPGHPEDGRVARPVIQKFAGDNFITDFLERPQHSLKFDPIIDVVNNYDLVSAKVSGPLAGKLASFLPLNARGEPATSGSLFRARLAPSTLRKLYLPAHDRHYIVSCELHCDQPGFPRVNRQKVCQAGFVLRRRVNVVPAGVTADMIETKTAPVRAAEAELLELLHLAATLDEPGASKTLRQATRTRQQTLAAQAGAASWDALLQLRRNGLATKRAELDAWYKQKNITVDVQGWFPSLQDGRPSKTYGAWKTLTGDALLADVADSGETSYPLFPLIPDPRETSHDAAGRTLYYGTVPTNGIEHDAKGIARFDDKATYELRCFVREHQPSPGRAGKKPDCCGPLVWSLATEPFRVAAPFDVLGAANRPITIKMPDLRELAAQAAMRPRGKLSPVRFVQPQHMSPTINGASVSGGSMSGEAICSFSIPLITIIALFVLSIFLPIVVFIFNLWFLLVFRFCIPPQIQAGGGVDLAIAATPPGVDLDADFAVEVSGVDQLASDLNSLLGNSMDTRIQQDTGKTDKPTLDAFSNNALGPLNQSLQDNAELKADASGTLSPPPPVGTPLVYEDPVTPVWPVAGAKT